MDAIRAVLGLDAETLGIGQMALRAAIAYAIALAFVRIGDKRFLGKNTAFDVAVAIMFGSVMSRAITGPEFLPVIVGGGVLVALHFVVALITFRSDRAGTLVKGSERRLVVDGEIQWDQMAAAHVTERDLIGALRTQGQLDDVSKVRVAHLERSGDVSVIERSRSPRVVSVDVAEGVQTVRIELVS
jgi:uncharacterized membrane protein YcaP (DUF421 family)